ncbi:MAG: response regulator [Mariprofundus sp.]|nr:response regulator [Mariprofundus sp.]
MQDDQILQILIVDDSSDDAFALLRAIKKAGFKAHHQRVESAEQLQQALTEQVWDIVLCDVCMPGLSVHRAIKVIDEFSRTAVSVVIVSGIVDAEEISRYIRGGVRDFVRKHDLSKLGDVLRREMGYVEARREQESEHERFIEAQKMEAVGTLAGGVAHDFNNILTALMGMHWKLKSDYPDHVKLINMVDKMDELCDRAGKLVTQLLGFARKGIVKMQPLDLGAFVTENISLLRMSVPDTIALKWQEPAQAVYISADVVQLQQMLVNMINNARDALADSSNPCISLVIKQDPGGLPDTATSANSWVALHVMDNGSGMDSKTQKHLFEPFYTTKEQDKGTGLGLAMVYGSMMTHHGFVDCNVDDCKMICDDCHTISSSIRLLFPQLDSDKQITSTAALEKQVNVEPMHVLLADDEAIIREVFCAIFKNADSQVDTFENGLLAWQQFQQYPDRYDVVVLDVSMPKMTGPEVAKKIREISSIPIVLISGYDVHSTLDLVAGLDNIHVQVKPFQPNAIFSEIQKLVGGKL